MKIGVKLRINFLVKHVSSLAGPLFDSYEDRNAVSRSKLGEDSKNVATSGILAVTNPNGSSLIYVQM